MDMPKGGTVEDVMTEMLTKEQVEKIIDERDHRLEVKLLDMIRAELAPMRSLIDAKASHEEVDTAIAKAVEPLERAVAEIGKQIEQLLRLQTDHSGHLARFGGMVEALTNVKSSDMQMIRDRQTDAERQLDVFRLQIAGVTGDVVLLMNDVRGAGKGDGNPSLFDLISAIREEQHQQRIDFNFAQERQAGEISQIRRIQEGDHKLIETIRTLGAKSMRAAFNASWNAFVKKPVQVQVAAVALTALGTLAAGAQVQGWLEPLLVWLLEQVR